MSDTEINATINVTEDVLANVDATAVSAAVIDDGDSIVVPAEVDFGETLDTELEDEELIDVPVDESVGIQGDHRILLHRDAANQHPMSAITGLDDAIAGINAALSSRISRVEAETAELDTDMASALLRIGDLQDQVDGNITTWFYAAEPAMNLPPVALDPSNPHDTGWDTIDKKNAHRGDLYYNTLTGYAYRFAYADGDYGWMRITDTDVVKALADAAHAQDTADSKRRVFYSTPYPPYDKGDLWVQGANGDILVCNASKAAGEQYSFSDWERASKYTDDYVANQALASANGKNTVYHQPNQPTGGTYKKGDTWFDSDDDYTMYTYDGALWIKEQFGNEAIADLSITNAKIKDATIEYAKIKSVDAGKITVGDLSADRMKVNAITAINGNTGTVKIDADKVNITGTTIFNKVNADASAKAAMLNSEIEVGGRNLIWDSEWRDIPHRWHDWGTPTTREIVTINGQRYLHLVTTTEMYQGYEQDEYYRNGAGEIKEGDKIVVSFTAYAKTAGQKATIGIHWRNSAGSIIAQSWLPEGVTTTPARYVSPVWTVPSGAVSFNLMVGDTSSQVKELWISRVMVEKATKASDWSPAPEDVQGAIDAKKSVHTLSTTYSYNYSQLLTYSNEYTTGWTVSSTAGVKTGDTVRLKMLVKDMSNAPVYVVGTVTSVLNSTYLYMTSHGLDTTIIDGGNILTNSIGANQIAANAIDTSKLTVGTRDMVNEGYEQSRVYALSNADINWMKIGHLKGYNARQVTISLKTGSGYNGESAQNTIIDINIKTGNGQSTTKVFGTRVVRKNAASDVKVKVIATATGSNAQECDVYIKYPWNYNDGSYTITGRYQSWTHAGTTVSSEPTGNSQEVVYDAWAGAHITEINDAGIKIHAYNNRDSNYAQIDSTGMDVYKGGVSVAKYGDTARIGRNSGKHIEIASDLFAVYDDDGSSPFVVSTNSSQKTQVRGYYTSLAASGTGSHNLFLRGTLSDGKIYIGVSTSGQPTSFPSSITVTTTEQTVTVSGVQVKAKYLSSGTISLNLTNTNSGVRYLGVRYTDKYRESLIKVEDVNLKPERQTATLVDSWGTSYSTTIYTYGHIAMLCIYCYRGADVPSGNILYQGTLLDYKPLTYTALVGESGTPSVPITGYIKSDGEITLHNSGSQTITSNSSHSAMVMATYIF